MSLTVANYLIQPFFPECDLPDNAKILLAAVFIMFLTWLNCYSIKVTTKLQGVFMFTKVAALIIVIIVGLVAFGQGMFNFLLSFYKLQNERNYISLLLVTILSSEQGKVLKILKMRLTIVKQSPEE